MKRSARDAFSTRAVIDDSVMEITTLGAGSEVGRSCILIKYKGKTIMLDCGVHPAYSGENSLPLYQNIDVKSVDLLLVSQYEHFFSALLFLPPLWLSLWLFLAQKLCFLTTCCLMSLPFTICCDSFHLDHAGALPNFLEKTNFEGAVYMTHPTKAITKMILMDFIKVSHTPDDLTLFTEDQIASAMRKIKTLHYHEELVYKGIKFWCYNAGHVLGAAMFMIEIDGARVLYTGDYSRQEDRHLKAAEMPEMRPHVLIVESTYGTQNHESKQVREESFIRTVHDTVMGGGRVLLPSFALGRAQELLLILDEHWRSHPELKDVPIYFATSLGKRCMVVYQTYVDMMVDRIQKRLAYDNPFVFKFIRNLLSVDKFHDTGPCVVMASPGMLQSGLSRDLFERWCSDSRNTVILSGYSVEGTLASEISKETQSQTVVSLKNHRQLPLRMKVHTMSFSAHVDYGQNASFVREVQPKDIVLVHGAVDQMRAFKKQMVEHFPKERVHAPRNLESVYVTFELDRTCLLYDADTKAEFEADDSIKKVMKDEEDEPAVETEVAPAIAAPSGAKSALENNHHVHGVLLVKNFDHKLIDISDLHFLNESGLVTTTVSQRVRIPLGSIKFEDLPHHLGQLFSELDGPFEEDSRRTISIGTTVKLIEGDNKQLLIKWNSTAIDDMIVDSVMALLAHVEANPFAVTPAPSSKLLKEVAAPSGRGVLGSFNSEASPVETLQAFLPFLKNQFDEVSLDVETLTLTVSVDGQTASFDWAEKYVTGSTPELEDRFNSLLDHIAAILIPIAL